MKILMAAMGLDIGGAETHIIELSKELKKRGHDVIIASDGGVYVKEAEKFGISHFCVPMDSRNPIDLFRSYRLLKKIIEKEKPDVVHAHARIPAFLCWMVKKHVGFSFVTTTHGVYETGMGLKYITKWGQKSIAVSDDIARYLTKNYGIRSGDIIITINGINTDKFSSSVPGGKVRREFGIGEDTPLVVHVSRQDPDSSLPSKQLIEGAPAAAERIGGIRYLIVGGGSEHEEIKRLAGDVNSRLGRECVIVTGPRTDINDVVAAADLFVGVSRAALEAMAEEKPVLLSGNAGYMGIFREKMLETAVGNNFCCRGCEKPEASKLAAGIVDFFRNCSEKERAELGKYGRSVVAKYYSIRKMADDCMRAYDEVMKPSPRFVLSGYYGFDNVGDEAILQTICSGIISRSSEAKITVLSKNPEKTSRVLGYNSIGRYNPLAVLRALKNCDVLISGGGSLLQDKTSTRSLSYYLFVIWLAKRLHTKVMLYANGIGPVEKEKNRQRMRSVLSGTDVITVRDKESYQELLNLGVECDRIYVTADPAFKINLPDNEKTRVLLSENGLRYGKQYAVFALRNWPKFEKHCRTVAKICDEIHERYGYEIIFAVMQRPNDIEMNRKVQQHMKHGSIMLNDYKTAEDLAGVFAGAEFVFSMRYHGLVFAACGAVPMVGIVYDPKMEAFFDIFNVPGAGYSTNIDYLDAIEAITDAMIERDRYKEILAEKAGQMKKLAEKNYDILFDLVNE